MNTDTPPTPDFSDWATSFSGCDGADLNAPIWFCGIEDGGIEMPKEYKCISKDDLQGISYSKGDTECRTCFPKFFTNNPYDMNALKLHAAIFSEFRPNGEFIINDIDEPEPSPDGARKYAEKHRAYEKHPTNARSIFKLNLYPWAFPSTDENHWGEAQIKISGLLTKELYKAWCVERRIMSINSWIPTTNKPRVIIGTGNYLNEFLLAFRKFDSVDSFVSTLCELKKNLKEFDRNTSELLSNKTKNKFKCYFHQKNDDPLLVVVPFLGVGGISSHKDINAIGSWISDLLEEHCGFNKSEKTFK